MDTKTFKDMVQEMIENEAEILRVKGEDYTVGKDVLDNFRRVAREMTESGFSIDMKKVWWIYFNKHLCAIRNFAMTGEVLSEPIEGRIMDARAYLILLRAIIKEESVLMPDIT